MCIVHQLCQVECSNSLVQNEKPVSKLKLLFVNKLILLQSIIKNPCAAHIYISDGFMCSVNLMCLGMMWIIFYKFAPYKCVCLIRICCLRPVTSKSFLSIFAQSDFENSFFHPLGEYSNDFIGEGLGKE